MIFFESSACSTSVYGKSLWIFGRVCAELCARYKLQYVVVPLKACSGEVTPTYHSIQMEFSLHSRMSDFWYLAKWRDSQWCSNPWFCSPSLQTVFSIHIHISCKRKMRPSFARLASVCKTKFKAVTLASLLRGFRQGFGHHSFDDEKLPTWKNCMISIWFLYADICTCNVYAAILVQRFDALKVKSGLQPEFFSWDVSLDEPLRSGLSRWWERWLDKNRLTAEEKAFGMLAEAGKGNTRDNPSVGWWVMVLRFSKKNSQAGGEGISAAIALVCINSVSELLRYRRVEVEWAGGSWDFGIAVWDAKISGCLGCRIFCQCAGLMQCFRALESQVVRAKKLLKMAVEKLHEWCKVRAKWTWETFACMMCVGHPAGVSVQSCSITVSYNTPIGGSSDRCMQASVRNVHRCTMCKYYFQQPFQHSQTQSTKHAILMQTKMHAARIFPWGNRKPFKTLHPTTYTSHHTSSWLQDTRGL